MDKRTGYFLIAIVALLISMVVYAKFSNDRTTHDIEEGYRRGQIAYAQGVIDYRLEKKPDGTTAWVKIQGGAVAQATRQVRMIYRQESKPDGTILTNAEKIEEVRP